MITLYDYYRSSSSYRVRIALELKNIPYRSVHVDLVGGENRTEDYGAINPQQFVPVLDDGQCKISQSLAIIEYLSEAYPNPPLIFGDACQKAFIRQMANIIACDIAPLNIPKVWKAYMGKKLNISEQQQMDWVAHWMHEGFRAYEMYLINVDTPFTCGIKPSLADVCLIPQLYNARRFHVALDDYPKIREIEKNCLELEAFQNASPEHHPNAPTELEQIHGKRSPVLANAA